MEIKKQVKRQRQRHEVLPWLCLAATWGGAVWFQWTFSRTMLDSDIASEMVLANFLNREGGLLGLLSTNWFYSTEIRVFCQQLLFRPLLLLFPHNWHLVRTVSQAILLAILAGSSLFLARAAKFGKGGIYITAALMCPLSFWYHLHVMFGGLYILYISFVLLNTGLVLRLARSTNRGKTFALYLVLTLISLAGGLNSVRMIMCINLPLLVAGFGMLVLRLHAGAPRKPFLAMPEVRMLAASLYAALLSAVGYLGNSLILAGQYHFDNQNARYWAPFSVSSLLDMWGDFFTLFGFPAVNFPCDSIPLFSVAGLLGAFGALLGAGVFISLVRVVGRWQKLTYVQKYLVAVLLACLLVMGAAFALTTGTSGVNSSYWLPIVPLGFVVLVLEVQTEDFRLGDATKRCLAGLFAFSVLASSASCVMHFFNSPLRADEHIVPVADWLVENDYTNGYATFWNANVMTELTNGQLELWTVKAMESLDIFPWMQSCSHTTPPDGRVFFLIKNEETDYNQLHYYEEGSIVYADDYFTVLAFDSAYEALDTITAAGGA